MPTPEELLAQSLAKFQSANRIDGSRASYRKDSPVEYTKVTAYLQGGGRPSGVTSDMGMALLLEEDARRALGVVVPPPPPLPPPSGIPLPTWRIDIPSGGLAHWLFHNSPTTQSIGTDGNGFRQRVIVWDTAGGQPIALYSQKTMYCLAGFRLVTGNPGRLLDWHTQENDSPYGYDPLDGPPPNGRSSSRVAPLAVDYFDSRGMEFILQAEDWAVDDPGSGNYHYPIFTQAQIEARRGQWVWLWVEVKLGRRDTPPDGALKVWVAGEDTPRVNVSNVNTHWWGEHQVNFLQGAYWYSGTPQISIEHAAARFGRTPQECYQDVPVFHSGAAYPGGGSHTAISSRSSSEPAIPAPLRWA